MDASSEERTRVGKYALTLQAWLAIKGLTAKVDPNPVLGQWELSDGAGRLEFDQATFTWWRHGAEPEGDARRGGYTLLRGMRLHQGFVVDHGKPDTGCFSVILRQASIRHEDAETPDERVDMLYLEQLGSPDRLGLYDHRTANRCQAVRLPAPTEKGTQ